ncbi:DUF4194 domain-containing protein [Stenotrophobium rhamnosiphilum]|uniref:DUF4194 domain-containing protein n=1 Tax=Stenotrophobium rhamnosiphilum TaxID=2029166 RepID=A0A2T5MBN6_9GAMM|nr:DUF4194 domain-containing protein [Stenotrophobium rhamnosiphilum]PTU29136.1 hypothetical protein CJD38_17460 [Stenotrophobium rhamnosiphilum]
MAIQSWDALASKPGSPYAAADFSAAAYALIAQQVLYASDRMQTVPYRIVSEHLSAYQALFLMFGLDVQHVATEEFVAAVPIVERRTELSLDVTLLVLTLRSLFHIRSSRGETDAGRAVVTIEEIREEHQRLTGRELEAEGSTLKNLIEQTKRMGMARTVAADPNSDQPYDVAIMPGIARLVNEAVVSRLAAHYQSKGAYAPSVESDEPKEPEDGDE